MKLRVGPKVTEVDPEVLENALQFSIQARMAPLWNKVKDILSRS